jgi:precorrin-6B methylase 2
VKTDFNRMESSPGNRWCTESGPDEKHYTPLRPSRPGTVHGAAAQFPDQSLDLIFIDGNHQYDAVLQDLHAWYPKLRSGGLLAGDDYAWPDVQEAVSAFSDQMGVPVAVIQSMKSAHPLFIMSAGN